MAAEQDTPAGDVVADAQDHEEAPERTKRQRTHADASKHATSISTPESPPNKRRRREPISAADDATVKEAESYKEKARKAEQVRDATKKKRKEEEKIAKQKAKEVKKAREAADKKRQAEDKAVIKAVKDKECEDKKKKTIAEKTKKQEEKEQKEHRKKQWEDYCTTHNFTGATLAEEPGESITQSDAGQYYTLKPNELACLPHHPRKNPLYKNTTKLFDEDEVRSLAYRKYAIFGGVSQSPESTMLAEGKKLWDDEGERLGKDKLELVTACPGGLARGIDPSFDGNGDLNWWRDPRELRRLGFKNGKLPANRKRASRKKARSDDESFDYNHHEDH
ncbi:hypothetical protein DPSP01_005722 [Paraphaeosphaeria sporulosa]|uniref:Uncharacterized protein n=1 Tax=Paraphaeosphaeria sporulosa TaxID=1460663 RepID=A0A177CU92_9PLEO|nr:uncharacterized protein CC84DRAFT_1202813 [Paraphaeosphaeria sporulosa]OAG10329.1 hypothetical protein CC84DRAFT_1202813 [Paraphaeosphaeria sporulosa]